MTSLAARGALTLSTLLATSALAAPTEIYTPALPAQSSQYQECRILNVTGASQTVTVEAFMSNGTSSSGPSVQTLAHGEAGGFSVPGWAASMYCKFTVNGKAAGYRTSIDVLEPGSGPEWKIAVSLPGA